MVTHQRGQAPATKALKPHKTVAEQLHLLASRGLAVTDPERALQALGRLGYYRLAGYFYPLRQPNPPGHPGRRDSFVGGASFELIAQLYEFDKRLRLLVLDAIETLEVALRVGIAHDLGRLASNAHRLETYFDGKFTKKRTRDGRSAFDDWQARFDSRMATAHDDFVQHHVHGYGGEMPIWVAIELWDFGMLSRFYEGLRFKDRNRIAHALGRLTAAQLTSWLKTLNFVRNVAAHHSRLWNRNVPEAPSIPAAADVPLLAHLHAGGAGATRLYAALCCAQYLLRTVQPASDWSSRLISHVANFPSSDLLSIRSAGFPSSWNAHALWGPGNSAS